MDAHRRRIEIACEPCRKGKRKCDGGRPICNLCGRRSKQCVYAARLPPSSSSKYTKHLRSEISRLQSLVDVMSGAPGTVRDPANSTTGSTTTDTSTTSAAPGDSHGLIWTSHAVQEVCSLSQRRVPPGGLGSTSIYLLDSETDTAADAVSADWHIIPAWPSRMHDSAFRRASLQCFSDRVNRFECLIDEDYMATVTPSLDQPYHMLVLVLAMFSASTVVTQDHQLGDSLVEAAERMVMRACVTPEATLVVVRALTVLVWRELTVGGSRTRTWMFNCMASALLQQLGIFDWSRDTIAQEQQTADFREKLCVFWSYSAVDRICAALLGRTTFIPWHQNIYIPRYHTVRAQGPPATIEVLYFDHLWALWRLHGYYMSIMYTPRFDSMQEADKRLVLLDCGKALIALRESIDPRLQLRPAQIGAHPFLYFLQMAFDTSPITLKLPFLTQHSDDLPHILQDMVTGASSHTDLLFRFRKKYQFTDSPPAVIYFTVRAATIHLLLSTSTDLTVQRCSSRRLKICLDSLEESKQMWERQAGRAIRYIQGLATRWGVTKALPPNFGPVPVPCGRGEPSDETRFSFESSPQLLDPTLWYDGTPINFDITGIELDGIQWALEQDNIIQLM